MGVASVGVFGTASADLDNYADLQEKGVSPRDEAGRAFVTADNASGTATLELALVDTLGASRTAIARFTGTATATARRTGNDGSSGSYVCDVSWAESSNSKFDLLGDGGVEVGANKTRYRWMLGVTAFGGSVTEVEVFVASSEEL